MENIRRILGKKGRITIPYEMRIAGDFEPNDVVTFSMPNERTVIVHKECICDGCDFDNEYDEFDNDFEDTAELIEELFDELDYSDKFRVLASLTKSYGEAKAIVGGGKYGNVIRFR